jgi:hypothetical protein
LPPGQLRTFLDIQNVLLKSIARRQENLSAFPSPPGPPSKALLKRKDRRWSASTWRMLKIIALMRCAIFEEPAVEVIVQPFV